MNLLIKSLLISGVLAFSGYGSYKFIDLYGQEVNNSDSDIESEEKGKEKSDLGAASQPADTTRQVDNNPKQQKDVNSGEDSTINVPSQEPQEPVVSSKQVDSGTVEVGIPGSTSGIKDSRSETPDQSQVNSETDSKIPENKKSEIGDSTSTHTTDKNTSQPEAVDSQDPDKSNESSTALKTKDKEREQDRTEDTAENSGSSESDHANENSNSSKVEDSSAQENQNHSDSVGGAV